MKITKEGKIKLSPGEKRIGHFVLRKEAAHMKVSDTSGALSLRVRSDIPLGMFMAQIYESMKGDEETRRGAENYLAVLWSVLPTIPDVEWLEAVYRASSDCMMRHPENYGVGSMEATDEEDAEIIRGERDVYEFEGQFMDAMKRLDGRKA